MHHTYNIYTYTYTIYIYIYIYIYYMIYNIYNGVNGETICKT